MWSPQAAWTPMLSAANPYSARDRCRISGLTAPELAHDHCDPVVHDSRPRDVRRDSLRIDERRDLEPDPPFARWAQRYATANASRELLLSSGRRRPVARRSSFSGARTASRLLLTSAAPFSVVTDGGDLADTLFSQSLNTP